jgi:hypothetical protein
MVRAAEANSSVGEQLPASVLDLKIIVTRLKTFTRERHRGWAAMLPELDTNGLVGELATTIGIKRKARSSL